MLKVLDKLRGQSTTAFRRALTKAIIDPTLKAPHRVAPVHDGYRLQVSKKVSEARLEELARTATEARMMDAIALKNAEQAAIEQAKIQQRLEGIGELHRAGREVITSFHARIAADEAALQQYHEAVLAEAKEQAVSEAAAMEQHYADRKRIRDRFRERDQQAGQVFAEGRLQAALARAERAQHEQVES